MTIEEAKKIDLVDYLHQLGHQPQRIKGNQYWYKSPLSRHEEKTASFKIDRKLNYWYDWSEAKNVGGNLVDFGILYHGCSVSEFLQQLKTGSDRFHSPKICADRPDNTIQILHVKSIESPALKYYLQHRQIPENIYNKYCQEVLYESNGKKYYSIGFKNDSGGYELRNSYSKLSSSPKDIRLIKNEASEMAVFEGFFNFLSYLVLQEKNGASPINYLVLNSASFFEKNMPLMQAQEKVHLYLDNDHTGHRLTKLAIQQDTKRYVDHRQLYLHYKDLNELLVGRAETHQLRLRHTQ